MATKHQLTAPAIGITCHAWNSDRSSETCFSCYRVNQYFNVCCCLAYTVIAVCPNNNEIHIYGNCAEEKWEKLHVLPEVRAADTTPVYALLVTHVCFPPL